MDWYEVVKTINGRRYRYRQRTWRDDSGRVRTTSEYIGPDRRQTPSPEPLPPPVAVAAGWSPEPLRTPKQRHPLVATTGLTGKPGQLISYRRA